MPATLKCKWELSFHLQQSVFHKMEQISFAVFGLILTREIFLSHEHSPPLHHYIQKPTVIAKSLRIDERKPLSVNVISIVLIRLTY